MKSGELTATVVARKCQRSLSQQRDSADSPFWVAFARTVASLIWSVVLTLSSFGSDIFVPDDPWSCLR